MQGVITDYTLNGLYLVEIRGPHVAFYVEGIDNMTISTIVCHPDSISIIGEPRTGAGSLD